MTINTTEEDRSRYIVTYTGRKFHPLDPTSNAICLLDIAHALALTNRYGGHTKYPYSVAQHSILISRALLDYGYEAAIWGLFHDATEAYLGDIVSPLKRSRNMDGYCEVEKELQRLIGDVFLLPQKIPSIVKVADKYIYFKEVKQLFSSRQLKNIQPEYSSGTTLFENLKIEPWDWQYAKDQFMVCYEEVSRMKEL